MPFFHWHPIGLLRNTCRNDGTRLKKSLQKKAYHNHIKKNKYETNFY